MANDRTSRGQVLGPQPAGQVLRTSPNEMPGLPRATAVPIVAQPPVRSEFAKPVISIFSVLGVPAMR